MLYEAGLERVAGVAGEMDVTLEPQRILIAILRRRRYTDRELAGILRESHLTLDFRGAVEVVKVRMAFRASDDSPQIPITDLTIASIIVWETSLRIGATLRELGVEEAAVPPPGVEVAAGSVSFSLGGSTMLASGFGFLVAINGLLPTSAVSAGYTAGVFLVSLGLVDLAVNWYKTMKEADKLDSETQLNLVRAEKERTDNISESVQLPTMAVDLSSVASLCQTYQIPVELGLHLMNNVLPAFREIRNSAGLPEISASREGEAPAARVLTSSV
jgi:hypothetical protein